MTNKEPPEEAWTWLKRDLPESFFFDMEPITNERSAGIFGEIHEYYKLLAYMIIDLGIKTYDNKPNCVIFRNMIYLAYKELKENHNIDLPLPYYWATDGVMVEPEDIVRITNGLIKWYCDESVDGCIFKSAKECIYYGHNKESEINGEK